MFSFSDELKATNCTFEEVDNIFRLAVGIAVYDEVFSCMCAAEFLCALDVFARHTSSRITFLTQTIVGRSRGDVSSHQDVFRTAKLSESNASAPTNKPPKTAWGTEMSSKKEGLQQCEH